MSPQVMLSKICYCDTFKTFCLLKLTWLKAPHVFLSAHILVPVQPAGVSEAGAELLSSCPSPRPAAQPEGEAAGEGGAADACVGASAGNLRRIMLKSSKVLVDKGLFCPEKEEMKTLFDIVHRL